VKHKESPLNGEDISSSTLGDSTVSVRHPWSTNHPILTPPKEVYKPFSYITEKALHHAVKEAGKTISIKFTKELMKAYDSLDTFPDVDSALTALSQLDSSRVNSVIFSNGTRQMVEASVLGSPSLRVQSSLFSQYVVIDEIPQVKRRYKPSPVTYEYLTDKLEAEKKAVWLVTSNPFDVDGAKRFGLGVCWVNRQGGEWIDGVGMAPDFVCKSVEECLSKILNASEL
jgi:2-haloacid dehalogenase